MSSIDPVESKKIAGRTERRTGMKCWTARYPVEEPKAIDGTLSIIVRRQEKEIFDKYTDLLKAVGSSFVYVERNQFRKCGKLANQMVVAANIGICAEAMTFAKKWEQIQVSISGDPRRISKVLRLWMPKVPMMLAGKL